MKFKITYIIVLAMLACGSGCKVAKKGKGGRQQPKNGPIPCPIKDC